MPRPVRAGAKNTKAVVGVLFLVLIRRQAEVVPSHFVVVVFLLLEVSLTTIFFSENRIVDLNVFYQVSFECLN